jgi:hypothetical protein
MFAIFGSGFGLYGYMPALLRVGETQQVILPARYREAFARRKDIRAFTQAVRWASDEREALRIATGVVLAKRPIDNLFWLGEALAHDNIEKVIIEKPVAPDPLHATTVTRCAQHSGKSVRVGYVFRFTDWGRWLLNRSAERAAGRPAGALDLRWSFMAHHYTHDTHNWKRSHASGGGVVRFYGIHLIALLAEAGYAQVQDSTIGMRSLDDFSYWEATFYGNDLPPVHVLIDARAHQTRFVVSELTDLAPTHSAQIFARDTPFSLALQPVAQDQNSDLVDPRVAVLESLCLSFSESDREHHEHYNKTMQLWRNVESTSSFIKQLE